MFKGLSPEQTSLICKALYMSNILFAEDLNNTVPDFFEEWQNGASNQ